MANGKQAERAAFGNENLNQTARPAARHERKGSAQLPSTAAPSKPQFLDKSSTFPVVPIPGPTTNSANPWQQATTKRHKKSKSTGGAKLQQDSGQPMPANEDDRKGG